MQPGVKDELGILEDPPPGHPLRAGTPPSFALGLMMLSKHLLRPHGNESAALKPLGSRAASDKSLLSAPHIFLCKMGKVGVKSNILFHQF